MHIQILNIKIEQNPHSGHAPDFIGRRRVLIQFLDIILRVLESGGHNFDFMFDFMRKPNMFG